MSPLLTELLSRFGKVFPSIAAAVGVGIFGTIFASVAGKLITRILKVSGIDSLADKLNQMEFISNYNIRIVPSRLIGRIIYYILLLIVIIVATDYLKMPAVSKLVSDLINYVPTLISAVVLLLFGLMIADTIKDATDTACKSLGIPSGKIIANFLFYFVFLTALISALSQAKIDTDFIKSNLNIILGAAVGAFGLGYGLASKDMMSNYLASFYSRDKVKIGDLVVIDGTKGIIVDMDNTSLALQQEDKIIVIPLSKVASSKIEIFQQID
jgi:small-conductance mechanosensitive channel